MKECQTQLRHGILGIVACVRGRRDGSLSHDPKSIMQAIGEEYELKDGTFDKPESYLGARIEKFTLPDGTQCWSMLSDKYVKAAVKIVQSLLAKDGQELKNHIIQYC